MSSEACMSHPQVPTAFMKLCPHRPWWKLPSARGILFTPSCSERHAPTTIHKASAVELFKYMYSHPWLLLAVVVMSHKPETQGAFTTGLSWAVHSSWVFSVLVCFIWAQWEQLKTATLRHLKMLLLRFMSDVWSLHILNKGSIDTLCCIFIPQSDRDDEAVFFPHK